MKVTMRIKLKEKDIDYDQYIGTCRIIEIFDDYISIIIAFKFFITKYIVN